VPIYEYKCENGHVFDVMQKFSDEPLTECTECGAPASRVLHSPAVHFKGSGFHSTDYGRPGHSATANGDSERDSERASDTGSSDADASDSKPADSSGSGSKPADSSGSDSKPSDSKARAAGAE
jgi:putative FmdB family regulatory protein